MYNFVFVNVLLRLSYVLGNNMNTFLNENWSDILKELQTSFENALAAAFSGISQQFFNRVPANQIFID